MTVSQDGFSAILNFQDKQKMKIVKIDLVLGSEQVIQEEESQSLHKNVI